MEEYSREQVEIAGDILAGNWEAAHEKAFALLQNEPDSIDSLVLFTAASAYGGFFQDAVDYGKKAVLWAEEHGTDIDGLNSLEMSVSDMREFVAQGYFGLKDFPAAANELEQMQKSLGQLPDSIKEFAVKNENMMSGADSALRLAEQLDASFENRASEKFYDFKVFESQICIHEAVALAGGTDFPSDLPVASAQKMATYLLRWVNCIEAVDENYRDENVKSALQLGNEWLRKLLAVLYQGNSEGKPEMETNQQYPAARECVMVLEKLAEQKNRFVLKMLGNIYASGSNVEKNPSKAFNYYQQAYENGETSALINLALYYDEGEVVEKDSQKALEYAKKAVDAGIDLAETVLGQIYVDSLGDIEQGLVWLKKGCAKGDEVAKNILLRLAEENITDFDKKLEFILDSNERLDRDIHALGTGTVTNLGQKYAETYMELEKYYIAPMDRLKFINVCLNVQVDLVSSPNGIVSGDYFIDQFEKLIAEDYEVASRIAREREFASRISNLSFAELMELMAAGDFNINNLNWGKIKDYYLPKAMELGWDGYYADGTGPWEPESSSKSSESAAPANPEKKPPAPAVDSRDRAPVPQPSKGGCYIATAVYGSYDCPEVWVLRRFRDRSLAKNTLGRLFIKFYYAVSPELVKLFGGAEWFQRFWKDWLDKIVQKLRQEGYQDTPYSD